MIRTFAELDLDPVLLEAIEEMGFSRPTDIQAQAIPQALDARDILASAPTGTGKTAAFGLGLLEGINPRFFDAILEDTTTT